MRKEPFGSVEVAALVTPLSANLFVVVLWAPLLWIPSGTPIRPMAPAVMAAIMAIFGLLSGLVLTGLLIAHRRYLLWVPCLALSLGPWPLSDWLLHALSAARNLPLSD